MKKRASAARADREALWEWNLASNRIHFSPRWISLVGCEEHEVGNTPEEWLNRVHPEELPDVMRQIEAARAGAADEIDFRHRLRHKDGRYRWTACRVSIARDQSGSNVRLMGVHVDITVETVTDRLTGLPNRLLLIDRLAHSIERAQKYAGFHYAVLLVDLGGQAPAPLLTAAARRLETSLRIANTGPTLRSNDVVARVDGDRFAVLLDGLKAVNHAKVVADRLLKEVLVPFTISGREVFLPASIGVAVSATGYARADEVLRDAETALHRAQVLGGSHCEVFDTAILESHQAELQLEDDLKIALEQREFRLLYQPIVSIGSNQVVGFEALVRWHHRGLGVIAPIDFIPIAERTELIVPLGEWILREACTRLKAWQDSLSLPSDLSMSVNLSGVQLKDPTLAERVASALRDSGLQPRSLVLELTESMAMDNPTGVKSLLMQLRSTGVRISIDDFGTGYSSLAHLRQLPVDALKIDRSFIRGIETRKDTADIVGTLTEMALQLGLYVVAEGIENEEQLALLRSLRCHAAQGYLFAKPLDEARAIELLNTGLAPPATSANGMHAPVVPASPAKWLWLATAAVLVLVAVGLLFFLPRAVETTPASDASTTAAAAEISDLPASQTAAVTPSPTGSAVAAPVSPLRAPAVAPANRQPTPPEPVAQQKASASPVTVNSPQLTADATDQHASEAPSSAIAPPPVAFSSGSMPVTPSATSLSIHVMHYHRVGHCVGHLVASGTGMAFVPDSTTNKDAFDFKYSEFVHVLQDDTLTIKSSTRTYRFGVVLDKDRSDPSLGEFEARIARWR